MWKIEYFGGNSYHLTDGKNSIALPIVFTTTKGYIINDNAIYNMKQSEKEKLRNFIATAFYEEHDFSEADKDLLDRIYNAL